jgi:GNAT superfamily N-acetyltransferase
LADEALTEYDGTVTPLEIVAVTDDATAKEWHSVDDATRPVDVPADPLSEVLPRLQDRDGTGHRNELWLGRVSGSPAVCGELELPTLDNETKAHVEVRVLATHRRNGHGSAMLAHLVERARSHGRCLLHGEIPEPVDGDPPAGPPFARSHGARQVLFEVRRKLELSTLDDAALSRLADEAWQHAGGYSLVQWVDRAPDDIVDDLAVLKGRMSTDAPLEDMTWDPERYDAERVRALEELVALKRCRAVATGARHDSTGQLVGFTDIGVNIDVPRVAYQWDTIVRPDHRGHRLGLLMKLANLDLLRRTINGVEIINTWNAAVNEHMISVNELIGFRPADVEWAWELSV